MHPPDAPAPLAAEQVLSGRYRMVSPIARGGMAEVWEAYDQVLSRPVAIKVLQRQYASDEVFLERFRREAVAAARLAHPGVVATFDAGADGPTTYMVMELVRGRTLRERLAEQGVFPPALAMWIAYQIADALVHAHRAGIIHRDIKPANILLLEDGDGDEDVRVKVADFGIAKAVEARGLDLTNTGMVLGTPRYLSPEQVEGAEPDARADLYALGVMCFEMLTSRSPFGGETEMAMAIARLNRAAPRVRDLQPKVPSYVDALVAELLATDPRRRTPSALVLRQKLGDVRHRLAGAGPGEGGHLPRAGTLGNLWRARRDPQGDGRRTPPPNPSRPRNPSPSPRPAVRPSAPPLAAGGSAAGRPPAPAPGDAAPAGQPPPSQPSDPAGYRDSSRPPLPPAREAPPFSGPPLPERATAFPPSGQPQPPPPGMAHSGVPRSPAPAPVGHSQAPRARRPPPSAPVALPRGPALAAPVGAVPTAVPDYGVPRGGTAGQPAQGAGPPGGGGRESRLRSRRTPGVIVAGLAVVALIVAALLLGTGHRNRNPAQAQAPDTPIPIASVVVWIEPPQHTPDNPGEAANTFDGNPRTLWQSDSYASPNFGGLGGEGLAIHLKSNTTLSELRVTSYTQGWAASAYVSDTEPDSLAGWGAPTDTQSGLAGDATFNLASRRGSWVMLFMTNTGPTDRIGIAELVVT